MTRRSGLSALKFLTVGLFAAPLFFVSTACTPQCVDKFDCKSLGRVTLKGTKNVVEAFEVLASLRVADATPPPSAASREA